MKKRGRKAQIEGQFVVYVISGIIIIMILLYGYKAIEDFRNKADTVSYIQFKKDFDNQVQSIAGDYGSETVTEIRLPKKHDEVCMASSAVSSLSQDVIHHWTDGSITEARDRQIALDSVADNEGVNIFFFKKGEMADAPLYISNLIMNDSGADHLHCFHAKSSRVKLSFVGEGAGTRVTYYTG